MPAQHLPINSLWTGGWARCSYSRRSRSLLLATLPSFSKLASFCVITVAATGVLNAQVRLEFWAAVLTTGYGGLVVAKAVFLMLLAGLGGLVRRRLTAGRTPVLRWAGLEVALMAVTLGLAAALTQPPDLASGPGRHAGEGTDRLSGQLR